MRSMRSFDKRNLAVLAAAGALLVALDARAAESAKRRGKARGNKKS